jgi:hypothetical protein
MVDGETIRDIEQALGRIDIGVTTSRPSLNA